MMKRAPIIFEIQDELVVASEYGCLKWPKASMRNSQTVSQTAFTDLERKNRITLARAQYVFKTGYEFKKGDELCHRCFITDEGIVIENGWCLTVDHMFIGTAADNRRDLNSKRRGDNSSHNRPVKDLSTGKIYGSYESAAKDCGIASKWDVKYSCFSKLGKTKLNRFLLNRLQGHDFELYIEEK